MCKVGQVLVIAILDILILEKVGFETRNITEIKSFLNNKKINISGRYSNYKLATYTRQSPIIHEAKSEIAQEEIDYSTILEISNTYSQS